MFSLESTVEFPHQTLRTDIKRPAMVKPEAALVQVIKCYLLVVAMLLSLVVVIVAIVSVDDDDDDDDDDGE